MSDNKSDNNENIDESVDIMKVFDIIDKFGSKTHQDSWAFYPEADIYSKIETLNTTAISYKIMDRDHFEQSARKPSYKGRRTTDDIDEKGYTEFGEIFETEIEIAFWGQEYRKVCNHREWFEKFIHKRKSELKKSGLIRFLFQNQEEDEVVEINNNFYVKQPVLFQVIHPRITKVPYEEIKSIRSKVDGCIDSNSFDHEPSTDYFKGRV